MDISISENKLITSSNNFDIFLGFARPEVSQRDILFTPIPKISFNLSITTNESNELLSSNPHTHCRPARIFIEFFLAKVTISLRFFNDSGTLIVRFF